MVASSACGPLAPTGWGQLRARSYQLEVETKFPPWRRAVCGRPPPRRARRKLMAPWSSFLPRPERRCWRPFRLGPRDPLRPEARGHGWAPTSPCPVDFPKPPPRGWTWRPGAEDCELGWPKRARASSGHQLGNISQPPPHPQVLKTVFHSVGLGGECCSPKSAKAAVELVFWSPWRKALLP